MPDGTVFEFQESSTGLYYIDSKQQLQLHGQVLVNTVAYTNSDYLWPLVARILKIKIGNPTTREFLKIASNNLLPNCPIIHDDIKVAEHIFGQDIGGIKGKTVQCPPNHYETNLKPIPMLVHKWYQKVTVCADIMFVNGLPFLISIS